MKVYLIRGSHTPDPRNTYLVPDDELRVSYPEKHRTKREHYVSGLGSVREVEGTGEFDRTQFEMSARQDGERRTTTATGSRTPFRYFRVKRSDLKKHVRVLAPDDVDRTAGFDLAIDTLNRQIRKVREERAEHVKAAWRRARPANSLDLADIADAKLAEIEEARRG